MKIIGKLGTGMAYSGVAIFILGFLLPSSYLIYFLLAGGILGGTGFYIMFSLDKRDDNKALAEYNQRKQKLISTGTLIEVPSDQCEVKSSTYVREKPVDFKSLDTEVDNAVFGANHTSMDNKDQNVIKFSTEINGEGITFISPIVYKQSDTLEFLLASRPTTNLYFNPNDINEFYWDLEFLREN